MELSESCTAPLSATASAMRSEWGGEEETGTSGVASVNLIVIPCSAGSLDSSEGIPDAVSPFSLRSGGTCRSLQGRKGAAPERKSPGFYSNLRTPTRPGQGVSTNTAPGAFWER
ncbi:hypothetical protein ISCGN_028886 [Ixodes scapularis]